MVFAIREKETLNIGVITHLEEDAPSDYRYA